MSIYIKRREDWLHTLREIASKEEPHVYHYRYHYPGYTDTEAYERELYKWREVLYRQSTSLEEAINKIPDYLYPIKVKITWRPLRPAQEDLMLWKRLYEEVGLTLDEIGLITGWASLTVRNGLHKMGVKTRRGKRKIIKTLIKRVRNFSFSLRSSMNRNNSSL